MVAILNGAEQNEIVSKKKRFLDSVEKWRERNADWLLSDSEAAEVFAHDNQIEADVRHPEDFDL